MKTRGKGHMDQLDGLRAFAVLGVLFYHFGPPKIAGILNSGTIGVRLFFVLSGFLITGILIDARRQAAERGLGVGGVFKAFYIRRFLRIFPLYYAVLAVCLIVNIPGARHYAPWHFTYTTNVAMAIDNQNLTGQLGHFWSLAVEEQFYIVWPTIILLVPRRALIGVLIGVILIGPTSRAVGAWLAPENFVAGTHLMPECLDSLGAGALLAALKRKITANQVNRTLCGALALGVVLLGVWLSLRYWQGPEMAKWALQDLWIACVGFAIIGRASDGFTGLGKTILENPVAIYIGVISYGVYVYHDVWPSIDKTLFHGAISRTLHATETGWTAFAVNSVVSIAIASLSWYCYERPINNLKRKFPYVPAAMKSEA